MAAAESYLSRLQELIRHSESLVSAADTGDWDALLAALEQRQAVMDEIDRFPAAMTDVPMHDRAAAQGLLERLAVLDLEVSRKVNIALANTRSAMDEARLASTTVSAYRKTMSAGAQSVPARFVDRQK